MNGTDQSFVPFTSMDDAFGPDPFVSFVPFVVLLFRPFRVFRGAQSARVALVKSAWLIREMERIESSS